MRTITFDHLFTGRAWIERARVKVDIDGTIFAVDAVDSARGEHFPGCALPGIPNLHSHAHQRAMAGLAERSGPVGHGDDSFWTWREVMYRHAGRMQPEQLEAVAAQLYVEMLEAGMTAVGEFQYLHHDPGGRPYSQVAEMSLRCLAAAKNTGIGLTSLPVLYTHGGFDNQPISDGQRRFASDLDTFLAIVEALEARTSSQHSVGIAPHSLRAVSPANLAAVLGSWNERGPVHIHVAEQRREVEDCLVSRGQRPVAWLLDHAPIDANWCLIHATHVDDDELEGLASSQAVAGLCPTTEANLGDGIFRARDFLDQSGAIGIGSDSHISVSPVEELRWLEYAQRLVSGRRAELAGGDDRSTGRRLLEAVLSGGAQALGRPIGHIAPGHRADFVVLDTEDPLLTGGFRDTWIDQWIFSGNRPLVRDVVVGGRVCVRNGRHLRRGAIASRFADTIDELRRDLSSPSRTHS